MLKKLLSKSTLLFALLLGISTSLHAGDECTGKAELSAAYVHIDILESGKTVHRMDLPGVKLDFNWRFYSAFVIRPTFLYAHSKNKNEAYHSRGRAWFLLADL